jgi:hypothetical protein
MAKCANCGSNITCGCQRRTLPDGKQGCTNCANKKTNTTNKVVNTTQNK